MFCRSVTPYFRKALAASMTSEALHEFCHYVSRKDPSELPELADDIADLKRKVNINNFEEYDDDDYEYDEVNALTCYNCKVDGHKAAHCPKRRIRSDDGRPRNTREESWRKQIELDIKKNREDITKNREDVGKSIYKSG